MYTVQAVIYPTINKAYISIGELLDYIYFQNVTFRRSEGN
jgi:hypothetical protein